MRIRYTLLALLISSAFVFTFGQTPEAASPRIEDIRSQLTAPEFAEYERWIALGPGGLPHTLEGFRTLQRLDKMLRSGLDTSQLQSSIGKAGDIATLKDLPARQGQRPTVAPFAIPHRQTDQHNTEAVRERQKQVFDEVVMQNSDVVHFQTSYFETHNQAVFLNKPAEGNQTAVPDTKGEIGHIHPTDGSMHFSLSPRDATEIVAKGWGELHGLAGQVYAPGKRLPATYMMVYSPRSEDEVAVMRRILEAAIRFSALKTQ
jgi:hypothetical protein